MPVFEVRWQFEIVGSRQEIVCLRQLVLWRAIHAPIHVPALQGGCGRRGEQVLSTWLTHQPFSCSVCCVSGCGAASVTAGRYGVRGVRCGWMDMQVECTMALGQRGASAGCAHRVHGRAKPADRHSARVAGGHEVSVLLGGHAIQVEVEMVPNPLNLRWRGAGVWDTRGESASMLAASTGDWHEPAAAALAPQ